MVDICILIVKSAILRRESRGAHYREDFPQSDDTWKKSIVMGKRKSECVMPYLEKLEWISENDEHRVVRIHSAGAVRVTKRALEKSNKNS